MQSHQTTNYSIQKIMMKNELAMIREKLRMCKNIFYCANQIQLSKTRGGLSVRS